VSARRHEDCAMPDVFISYSRSDREFVAGLADDLKQRRKDVWVDVEGIRDAEVFPAALRRAIESSTAFIFVISPDSVASAYCEQEVAHATELNKRIVPLALREVPDEDIPEQIRFRNWIPVDAALDADVDRIVAALDTDLDWQREHTRVTVRALEWDERGRERSSLLGGAELAAAERWLAAGADKEPGPTALQQEYLLAARQAAARRQRGLVGGSLAVAAIAVALLIFALISRSQAVNSERNARAQALAAESGTQRSVDGERAVLLAAAAVRTKVTYGATGTMFALRAAIDASPIRYRLPDAGVQGCGGPGVAYDPAPRSNLLAEALCNGDVRFANAATGRIERTAHVAGVTPTLLEYTPGGSALVEAGGVRLDALDPVTGAVRARSPVIPGLTTFGVDPRAPVVAAVGSNELALWDITSNRLTVIRPPGEQTFGYPSAVAFSPDASHVAVGFGAGGSGPGLIVADLAQRRIVRSLPTPVAAISYSPAGRQMAVGEVQPTAGQFVVLDASTLRADPRFAAVTEQDVNPASVAFSPDGGRLAYGFADGGAGLVSASTGQAIDSYSGDNAVITAVSFSPDGQVVATGSQDGTVRAWSATPPALGAWQPGGVLNGVAPLSSGLTTMLTPGDGPGNGVVAERWRDDGRLAEAPVVLSRTANVDAAFLSPNGQLAAVIVADGPASNQGHLRIFSVASRHLIRTLAVPLGSGSEPVISPNGRYVAMGAQQPPTGPAPPPNDLDIVDLSTGRLHLLSVETACGGGWRGFAFDRTSTLLAAGTFCGDETRVWSLASLRPVGGNVDLGGELAWTAFAPDGRHLAIASWNGVIDVSPVPIGGHVSTLTENTRGTPMVAYSPDGRYLASAGLDHTVRIFDARTLNELRVTAQPDAAEGVAFTADSRDVLSWGAQNVIRRWDACTDCEDPTALLGLAQSRVTRQLSPIERAEFGVG